MRQAPDFRAVSYNPTVHALVGKFLKWLYFFRHNYRKSLKKVLGLGAELLGLFVKVLGLGANLLGLFVKVLRLGANLLGLFVKVLGLGANLLGLFSKVLILFLLLVVLL